MEVNRRQFCLGVAAATVGLNGCAPYRVLRGPGSGSGRSGAKELSLAWWGNPTRNKNTQAQIDAFVAANPDVRISSQPGEWASYWEKLATQTAGNTAPDIIQMDMSYISEYGNRGALLNLEARGVDTSKFVAGTVDSGRVDDQLVGFNAGINTACLFANPTVFDRANMTMPDDTSWTWDDLMEVAAEVRSKAKTTFGVASFFGSDSAFSAWLRQHGKELFTPNAPGFDASDAQGWFDLMVKFQRADATASPQQISEEDAKPLDQSTLVVGTAAMQFYNSNQLQACRAASGEKLELLRFPSLTGKATERRAWYKASQLWSASARSKNPDAAAAWINWWVNEPAAANIDLAERGIPANGEIQAEVRPKLNEDQQAVAKFITDIELELGPTPIAPPPGGGTLATVMFRYQSDVLFGKTSTADAAQKFVDEIKSNLQT